MFQGFCLAFKNVFFQELLSLPTSLPQLKSVNCSLQEVIYRKGVLKISRIFPRKQPYGSLISIYIATPSKSHLIFSKEYQNFNNF